MTRAIETSTRSLHHYNDLVTISWWWFVCNHRPISGLPYTTSSLICGLLVQFCRGLLVLFACHFGLTYFYTGSSSPSSLDSVDTRQLPVLSTGHSVCSLLAQRSEMCSICRLWWWRCFVYSLTFVAAARTSCTPLFVCLDSLTLQVLYYANICLIYKIKQNEH